MTIKTKLPLYTSFTVLVAIVTVTVYSIVDFRSKTIESIELYKEEQTGMIEDILTDNVNNAYTMVEQAHEMTTASSKVDPEDFSYRKSTAQMLTEAGYLKMTVENIRSIRFGDDGYIWINEIDPPYTVVMHPISPHMEGTAQYFYIKETQQNVYEAFADVIHENNGSGFLEYDFYRPGSDERIPKLSFIKLYEPLGWVIGTGVYVDYIDKMVAAKTEQLNKQTAEIIRYTILVGVLLIALASAALFFFGKNITDAIDRVRSQLYDMSKGRIVKRTEKIRQDEIGDMTQSLNGLIEGVTKYSEFALQIGEGNLQADFSTLSDDDTLGNSLLAMRSSLQNAAAEEEARRRENEKRNWANEGYTKFSELMRKSSDEINEMAFEIISNLVDYVGATQGGLFIYNNEDTKKPVIEMAASVAYGRRKFKEKQILPGDGLIGACFLEKKKIYMTDVPEEYTEIKSGLGTANPSSILILPLMIEDNVIGIIELAAFKKFEDFEIEFTEKVSESIAASVYAAKINAQAESSKLDYEIILAENKSLEEMLKDKEAEVKRLQKQLKRYRDQQSILSND